MRPHYAAGIQHRATKSIPSRASHLMCSERNGAVLSRDKGHGISMSHTSGKIAARIIVILKYLCLLNEMSAKTFRKKNQYIGDIFTKVVLKPFSQMKHLEAIPFVEECSVMQNIRTGAYSGIKCGKRGPTEFLEGREAAEVGFDGHLVGRRQVRQALEGARERQVVGLRLRRQNATYPIVLWRHIHTHTRGEREHGTASLASPSDPKMSARFRLVWGPPAGLERSRVKRSACWSFVSYT